MRIYTVGGAVRDDLLGLPVHDRDYVVVGATPDAMLARGFMPVGKDFPVFLHPKTREEYALARTERKTGRGYKGFVFHASPDVSLEDDLARRDLTINAMARADDGSLIDPFRGVSDLNARILRHVGQAFAEDPVRVLRVARFAARFPAFTVAEETLALMRGMTLAGELDYLVTERLWQEIARGLMAEKPSRMILVLQACGALSRLLPEIDALFGAPDQECGGAGRMLRALDDAARKRRSLPVRFAVLLRDLDAAPGDGVNVGVKAVCGRLRPSSDCRDLALLAARYCGELRHGGAMDAEDIVRLLERADAFRRPDRFLNLLEVCDSLRCANPDGEGAASATMATSPSSSRFYRALIEAKAVDAGEIARCAGEPLEIARRIHAARVAAVR